MTEQTEIINSPITSAPTALSAGEIEKIKLRGTYLSNIGVAMFGAGALQLVLGVTTKFNELGWVYWLVLTLFICASVGFHWLGGKHLMWIDKTERFSERSFFGLEKALAAKRSGTQSR